ncbi:hypothetical protein D3C71_1347780 [compost metagenome]
MNNQIQQTYARTTSSGSGGTSNQTIEKEPSMANTVQNAALAKPVAVFLRGLTVRLSWAKAGPDGDLNPAYGEAEGQGFKDFEVGRALADVPPLFADVPELASFWSKGWEHAYVRHSPEFL